MIQFERLSKRFAHQTLFSRLTLRIPTQGLTFLLGRSGIGKSVLLKTAVGLIPKDSGKIFLDERDLDGIEESEIHRLRQQYVYVPQLPALFDGMTLLENVLYPLRLLRAIPAWSERKGDAEALMERLGIPRGQLQKMPREASLGVQKLTSLARAMLLQPKVLLLDEPTTGLGPSGIMGVTGALQYVVEQEGRGCVVVSHDVRSAMEYGTWLLLLGEGGLLFEGTADAFRKSPQPLAKAFREATLLRGVSR